MNNWDRRKFSDIKSGPYVERESRMKPVIKKVQFEYFWKKSWEFREEWDTAITAQDAVGYFSQSRFSKTSEIFSHWCKLFLHCIGNRLFSIVIFFNCESRSNSRFFKGARYRFTHSTGIWFKQCLLKLSYLEPCQQHSQVKGFNRSERKHDNYRR